MKILGIPIKWIVTGLAALGVSAGLWFSNRKNDFELKKALDKTKDAATNQEKLKGIGLLVYAQKKELIDSVKRFYDTLHYNGEIFEGIGNDFYEIESEETIGNDLIELLSDYVTSLAKLKECFQRNVDVFLQEPAIVNNTSWANWNAHIRLMFRDIVILSDFIVEQCSVELMKLLNSKVIENNTVRISAYLEQYTKEE